MFKGGAGVRGTNDSIHWSEEDLPDAAVLHPDVFWYSLNGMGAQKNAPKKFL